MAAGPNAPFKNFKAFADFVIARRFDWSPGVNLPGSPFNFSTPFVAHAIKFLPWLNPIRPPLALPGQPILANFICSDFSKSVTRADMGNALVGKTTPFFAKSLIFF